jgi:hypothetical protein
MKCPGGQAGIKNDKNNICFATDEYVFTQEAVCGLLNNFLRASTCIAG